MSRITRAAVSGELDAVESAALATHVVSRPGEVRDIAASEPWRVRVTGRGEAVLLGRWREHLDDVAVLGLWCSTGRIPAIMLDLLSVAVEHGFARLVGPLVTEARAAGYHAAGLTVIDRVLTLRADRPALIRGGSAAMPTGVTIRRAGTSDLDAIHAIDADCFDRFWHYDRALLERYLRHDRAALAERGGRPIGYTLATARSSEGCLGRLGVVPDERGHGVGRALVAESVAWMTQARVRSVTLTTQEGNQPSRHLYRELGFRELPGSLVVCASGPLRAMDQERSACLTPE